MTNVRHSTGTGTGCVMQGMLYFCLIFLAFTVSCLGLVLSYILWLWYACIFNPFTCTYVQSYFFIIKPQTQPRPHNHKTLTTKLVLNTNTSTQAQLQKQKNSKVPESVYENTRVIFSSGILFSLSLSCILCTVRLYSLKEISKEKEADKNECSIICTICRMYIKLYCAPPFVAVGSVSSLLVSRLVWSDGEWEKEKRRSEVLCLWLTHPQFVMWKSTALFFIKLQSTMYFILHSTFYMCTFFLCNLDPRSLAASQLILTHYTSILYQNFVSCIFPETENRKRCITFHFKLPSVRSFSSLQRFKNTCYIFSGSGF